MSVTHTIMDSPVGELTLVADDDGLTGLFFPSHVHLPDPVGFGERSPARFGEAIRQLEEYFAGERTEFELPLNPKGTPFQLKVWKMLETIPYGQTWSYLQLALSLGDRNLTRAVGAANGRNPISIIVPCHRVIGSGGKLTGFGGGLDRKSFLLGLEEDVAVAGDRLF